MTAADVATCCKVGAHRAPLQSQIYLRLHTLVLLCITELDRIAIRGIMRAHLIENSGGFVRINWFVVFLSVLLFGSASAARADTIPLGSVPLGAIPDPDIDISDPPCVEACPPGVGLTFTFSADATGGGIVSFTNISGQTWTSLLITTGSTPFFVDPGSIVCTTNAFVNCVPQNLGGGTTAIYLSGTNEFFHGIPN